MSIIADTHGKLQILLLNGGNRRIQFPRTPRELTSLILSGAGRPTFVPIHQIKIWLDDPDPMPPGRAVSIVTTVSSRFYDELIQSEEYIISSIEPQDPDQPVRGNSPI